MTLQLILDKLGNRDYRACCDILDKDERFHLPPLVIKNEEDGASQEDQEKFREMVLAVLLESSGNEKCSVLNILALLARNNTFRMYCTDEKLLEELCDMFKSSLKGAEWLDHAILYHTCQAICNLCADNDQNRAYVKKHCGGKPILEAIELSLSVGDENLGRKLRFAAIGLCNNYIDAGEEYICELMSAGLLITLKSILRFSLGRPNEDDTVVQALAIISILILHEVLTKINKEISVILVDTLRERSFSPEVRNASLEIFYSLSRSDKTVSNLAQAGLCELCVQFVTGSVDLSEKIEDDNTDRFKQCCDLIVLTLGDVITMRRLFDNGKGNVYLTIVEWLSNDDRRLKLCSIISLGNFSRNDEHCVEIVKQGVAKILMRMLNEDEYYDEHYKLCVQRSLLDALKHLVIAKPNREILVNDGLLEALYPLFDKSTSDILLYKVHSIMRLAVSENANAAYKLGMIFKMFEKLSIELPDTAKPSILVESPRLLASIIRAAGGTEVVLRAIENHGVSSLASMLKYDHPVLQSESLISLNTIATFRLVESQDKFVACDIGRKFMFMLKRKPSEDAVKNIVTLLTTLRKSETVDDYLVQCGFYTFVNDIIRNENEDDSGNTARFLKDNNILEALAQSPNRLTVENFLSDLNVIYMSNTIPLPQIQVEIERRKCHALIDTASSKSFVSFAALPVPYEGQFVKFDYEKFVMLGDDKTGMRVIGTFSTPVRIGKWCEPVTFFVASTLKFNVILGNDWLTANRAQVDYYYQTLTFGRMGTYSIEFSPDRESDAGKLLAYDPDEIVDKEIGIVRWSRRPTRDYLQEARDYEISTCASQPNRRDRSYSEASTRDGYSAASMRDGYSAAPTRDGYSAAATRDGYSAASMRDGYSAAPPTRDGYSAAPMRDAYSAAPKRDGYPAAPTRDGYSAAPARDGYSAAHGSNFSALSDRQSYPMDCAQESFSAAHATKSYTLPIVVWDTAVDAARDPRPHSQNYASDFSRDSARDGRPYRINESNARDDFNRRTTSARATDDTEARLMRKFESIAPTEKFANKNWIESGGDRYTAYKNENPRAASRNVPDFRTQPSGSNFDMSEMDKLLANHPFVNQSKNTSENGTALLRTIGLVGDFSSNKNNNRDYSFANKNERDFTSDQNNRNFSANRNNQNVAFKVRPKPLLSSSSISKFRSGAAQKNAKPAAKKPTAAKKTTNKRTPVKREVASKDDIEILDVVDVITDGVVLRDLCSSDEESIPGEAKSEKTFKSDEGDPSLSTMYMENTSCLPQIRVEFERRKHNALIDTASSKSLISFSAIPLPYEGQYVSLQYEKYVTQGDDKTGLRVAGTFSTPVTIGTWKEVVTFFVVPTLKFNVIFGNDWLCANRAQIDYYYMTVTFGRSKMVSAEFLSDRYLASVAQPSVYNSFELKELEAEIVRWSRRPTRDYLQDARDYETSACYPPTKMRNFDTSDRSDQSAMRSTLNSRNLALDANVTRNLALDGNVTRNLALDANVTRQLALEANVARNLALDANVARNELGRMRDAFDLPNRAGNFQTNQNLLQNMLTMQNLSSNRNVIQETPNYANGGNILQSLLEMQNCQNTQNSLGSNMPTLQNISNAQLLQAARDANNYLKIQNLIQSTCKTSNYSNSQNTLQGMLEMQNYSNAQNNMLQNTSVKNYLNTQALGNGLFQEANFANNQNFFPPASSNMLSMQNLLGTQNALEVPNFLNNQNTVNGLLPMSNISHAQNLPAGARTNTSDTLGLYNNFQSMRNAPSDSASYRNASLDSANYRNAAVDSQNYRNAPISVVQGIPNAMHRAPGSEIRTLPKFNAADAPSFSAKENRPDQWRAADALFGSASRESHPNFINSERKDALLANHPFVAQDNSSRTAPTSKMTFKNTPALQSLGLVCGTAVTDPNVAVANQISTPKVARVEASGFENATQNRVTGARSDEFMKEPVPKSSDIVNSFAENETYESFSDSEDVSDSGEGASISFSLQYGSTSYKKEEESESENNPKNNGSFSADDGNEANGEGTKGEENGSTSGGYRQSLEKLMEVLNLENDGEETTKGKSSSNAKKEDGKQAKKGCAASKISPKIYSSNSEEHLEQEEIFLDCDDDHSRQVIAAVTD